MYYTQGVQYRIPFFYGANMTTKIFPQSLMKDLSYGYGTTKVMGDYNEKTDSFAPDIEYEVLHNEQCNTTRWNSVHNLVFLDKSTGKTYHTQYEIGLTESQYLSAFDYDKEGVECTEVQTWEEQVTYTVLKWRDVNDSRY